MSPRKRQRPLSVRAEAARIVSGIARGNGTVESAMGAVGDRDARDLALLRALVSGALRWHHRLDWLVQALVDDRQRRIDPIVSAVLHVGLLQLTELRIPDHAAVAATVDAVVELGRPRARGFVNALLRRFLRERETLNAATDPVYRYSHPQWLIDALAADWPDEHAALLDANNAPAPMWLRVNLTRTSREAYIDELAAAGHEATAGDASEAALRMTSPCRTSELPGYAEGRVSVQDAAPQLAAGLLDLAPGLRVLDACAAPGGKTAHMLERCPALGAVVAIDRDSDRLEHVGRELRRLGHTAELIAADAARPDAWWDGRRFDRVLLDAPCTGTGVIRRHPEIKLRRTPADVERARQGQSALLEALWPLVAPGGRLVYATCSVLSAENTAVIDRFLGQHDDVRCEPLGSATHFRVRTGAADMDGFYYACLNRHSGTAEAR